MDFGKETDGFFARHFDRYISGAVTRLLLRTPATPNQVTVAVTALGVYAGTWFALPGRTPKMIGSLLFLLTSILDGCDGEIARARKMTSRLGAWLDLWGDNVVHVAVFTGMGAGLARDHADDRYWTLGLWASAGTLLAAGLVSAQLYLKQKRQAGGGFTSVVEETQAVQASPVVRRLIAVADALARRDFIYGVVVLAIVGWLGYFLWATAVGVTVYCGVLIALSVLTRRRPA